MNKSKVLGLPIVLAAFGVLVVTTLVGCSPVYRTTYAYMPIAGRQGQACSNQCDSARQQCQQMSRQITMQCQTQAQADYRLCEATKTYGYNKKGEVECLSNCYCSVASCSDPDFATCEENYKNCYLNCGGEVKASTSCVNFCDQANTQAPRLEHLKKNTDGMIVDLNSPSYQDSVKPKSSKRTSVKTNKAPDDESDAQSEMERINAAMRSKAKSTTLDKTLDKNEEP